MPSTDKNRREQALAAARARILATAPDPHPDLDSVVRRSQRMHAKVVSGDTSPDPTEVVVRLHGSGVQGHKVAVEYATPLLEELQRTIKWIGASIRRDLDGRVIHHAGKKDRRGLAEATRLFLQPQFGAGSLIFHLAADVVKPDTDTLGLGEQETLLDQSVKQLLAVISDAQDDTGEDTGVLVESVRSIGSRAASAMDRVAAAVVKNEIDIDLTWSSGAGSRKTAKLRRRGALAIQDAVQRNRVQTRNVELHGLLETASVGTDLVRIATGDGKAIRLSVEPEIGRRLGPLLNQQVHARAEETVTWKAGGNETKRYVLLAVEAEQTIPPSA